MIMLLWKHLPMKIHEACHNVSCATKKFYSYLRFTRKLSPKAQACTCIFNYNLPT